MSITIKDIAEMAQVSVATVSRVINGNGYVKKETKETIENLLKQTGYTPTARAQKKDLAKFAHRCRSITVLNIFFLLRNIAGDSIFF